MKSNASIMSFRAVARSENLGGHIVLGGDNVPPLVEIGLTDLPKSGGARAPPAPPLATGLYYEISGPDICFLICGPAVSAQLEPAYSFSPFGPCRF